MKQRYARFLCSHEAKPPNSHSIPQVGDSPEKAPGNKRTEIERIAHIGTHWPPILPQKAQCASTGALVGPRGRSRACA